MSDPLMLTPAQAAKRLGIGRTWMFELLRRDREGKEDGIPSVLLGRRKRLIPESALRDYASRLADGHLPRTPRPPRRLRAAPEKGPPSP